MTNKNLYRQICDDPNMKLQKYCRLARTVSTCRMAIHRRGSLSKGTKLKLKDHMVFIRRRIENEGPYNRIYTEQNRGNSVMYLEKPLGSQKILTIMSVCIFHRMVTKRYMFFFFLSGVIYNLPLKRFRRIA